VQPPKVGRKQRQPVTTDKELDVSSREDLNYLLAGLTAWQFNERLGRLEQSLQQLELINGTTLSLLQKIVLSIVPDKEGTPKESSTIVPETKTKTKRSKPRITQKTPSHSVSSGELPLNEPSSVVLESEQAPKEPE
jgi:hypothetical protein